MNGVKKSLSILLCLTMLISIFAGCGKKDDKPKEVQQNQPITVTDQAGRQITLAKPAEKIVSSYYISTAILIALNCENKLTGIEMKADTRELYRLAAPQLLKLPAVGSGKGINVEETAALAPDLVILPAKLKDSVPSFEALNIPVVVVDPETQENFEACVTMLAKLTGTSARGEELLKYYHEKTQEIIKLTQNLNRPAVYLSAGSGYLSTCTSKMYQNDLIIIAGGRNVSSELQDGYWAKISPEQLLMWNPEFMFAVSYAEYSLDDIKKDKNIKTVKAIKNDNVSTFPSQIEPWDYPTPSSILGIMWLASRLHPEVYSRETFITEAKEFYLKFFDITVTEEQLGA